MGIKIKKAAPVLPYAGSSGHSGSETSRARARELDESGKTGTYQRAALSLLEYMGAHGVTGLELTRHLNSAHTTGPSVLSVLHKDGRVTKLSEARENHQVYVLPEFVNGREEVPHRPHRGSSGTAQNRLALIKDLLDRYDEGQLSDSDFIDQVDSVVRG